ncbi:ubiquinol oxidase subunit II [Labrys okinawensis]|uniref:Ubiquinol oxidase subunit 2 n=1 Tax=Labrys okinawensis TaxID=346911 RepID=A0A2S9QI71_9HYPH|nr:ubiquinol oxidase subunit II [Labrys okinawensis]PRH89059.1 ubiquinol oxidase subunit II [Labrys okinawensis]
MRSAQQPLSASGWPLRGAALGFCALCLPSCSGVLNPLGPVGAGDAEILVDATVVMLVIVIPTIILAFWMAWRYRASNKAAEYLPYWSYSGRIEAVVWSIPILTIMFIGGLIWIGSHKLDPFAPLSSREPTLEVQVVSLDWKWLFIYPQYGVASVNELVVPVGTPVRFSITSASVFNTFFIPRLGSMIYAMPGMVSRLHLQADSPTQIWGTSAQFSGDGFSDMQFQVRSVPGVEFGHWVDNIVTAAPVLDKNVYAGLLRQSQRVPPTSYRLTDPGLFDAVATQALPPGPGPMPGNSPHAGRELSAGGKD